MTRNIKAVEQFQDKMVRFRRRNLQDAKRIDRLIEDLLEDPYHNTKVSRDPKMPVRIDRAGDRRVLYQYCRDCRLREVQNKMRCADCAGTPDETIMLFDFDDRDNIYDKKRHR